MRKHKRQRRDLLSIQDAREHGGGCSSVAAGGFAKLASAKQIRMPRRTYLSDPFDSKARDGHVGGCSLALGAEESENEDARKRRGASHEDLVLNRAVHVLTLYMFTQCFYREQSLRVNALMINPRSSEERLSIALFSCARLIKNGMTSATFPYGTSLATR